MKYLGVVTNNNLPELIFTPMTPNEESSHSLFCQLSAIQVNQLIVALENTAFKVNVWNEQFRFTANSHQAQHLRDKHLLASLHQNYTESIRATFFVYSDGIVDLILTASRSHFSRQTLEQIAADCVLQATESPQASHSDRVKTEIDTTFATTDTIVHQIEGEPCDQRLQWLTALSLSVYQQHQRFITEYQPLGSIRGPVLYLSAEKSPHSTLHSVRQWLNEWCCEFKLGTARGGHDSLLHGHNICHSLELVINFINIDLVPIKPNNFISKRSELQTLQAEASI